MASAGTCSWWVMIASAVCLLPGCQPSVPTQSELLPRGLLESLSCTFEHGEEHVYLDAAQSAEAQSLLLELIEDSNTPLQRAPYRTEVGQLTVLYSTGEGKNYRPYFLINVQSYFGPSDQLPLIEVVQPAKRGGYVIKSFPAAKELRIRIEEVFEKAKAIETSKGPKKS